MLDNAAYSAYYAETRKKLLGLGPDPKGKGKAKMRQAPGDDVDIPLGTKIQLCRNSNLIRHPYSDIHPESTIRLVDVNSDEYSLVFGGSSDELKQYKGPTWGPKTIGQKWQSAGKRHVAVKIVKTKIAKSVLQHETYLNHEIDLKFQSRKPSLQTEKDAILVRIECYADIKLDLTGKGKDFSFQNYGHACVIMEIHKPLRSTLKELNNQPKSLYPFFTDYKHTLDILHQLGYIHREPTIENAVQAVEVDGQGWEVGTGRVLLVDMGSCVHVGMHVAETIPLGLPSYMDFNTAVEYIYAEVMSGVQHTGAFQEAWTAEDRVSLVAELSYLRLAHVLAEVDGWILAMGFLERLDPASFAKHSFSQHYITQLKALLPATGTAGDIGSSKEVQEVLAQITDGFSAIYDEADYFGEGSVEGGDEEERAILEGWKRDLRGLLVAPKCRPSLLARRGQRCAEESHEPPQLGPFAVDDVEMQPVNANGAEGNDPAAVDGSQHVEAGAGEDAVVPASADGTARIDHNVQSQPAVVTSGTDDTDDMDDTVNGYHGKVIDGAMVFGSKVNRYKDGKALPHRFICGHGECDTGTGPARKPFTASGLEGIVTHLTPFRPNTCRHIQKYGESAFLTKVTTTKPDGTLKRGWTIAW